jgi:hypothetical protein
MDVEFSVCPMDEKLWKSSSLQRVMAILLDMGQLKGYCLEFCFYYMFLLRIFRVFSNV